jgi:hypothetical protein
MSDAPASLHQVQRNHVLAAAPSRAPGFVAAYLTAASEVRDDRLLIDAGAWKALRAAFPPLASPREYPPAQAAADAKLWPGGPTSNSTGTLAPTMPASPAPVAIRALPRAEWPLWTLPIALMRNERDKGVGDTVARHLAALGADALKRLYTLAFNEDCGCGQRQALLNRRFPY